MWTLLLLAVLGVETPGPGFSVPRPSPDGRWIAFTYQGDLWVVPREGGRALRLTDSDGYETGALWTSDGKTLVFYSSRYDDSHIFVMPADGSAPPRRLTFFGNDWPLFLRHDTLYFASRRTEFRGAVYRIPLHGAKMPEKVLDFEVLNAAPVPGTDTLVIERGATNWWRRRYRGPASRDLWLTDLKGSFATRITDFAGRDAWPMVSPRDRRIYFVSNEGPENTGNLWSMNLDGTDRRQLTHFTEEVLFPAMSADGSVIAFESLGHLYVYDVATGTVQRLEIQVPRDPKGRDPFALRLTRDATHFALSPRGDELAFIVYGQVFVMELKDGTPGTIRRITRFQRPCRDVAWHPKEEQLVFASLEDGDWDLYTARPKYKKRFVKDQVFEVRKLLDTPITEARPLYSPDGKYLAFLQNQGTLVVARSDGTHARPIAPWNDVIWADWSPDSRWLAFSRTALGWREDVYIVPRDGSRQPFNLSDHPNDDYRPLWSSDGRRLSFASRNAEGDLWIKEVYLREEDALRDRSWWEEHRDSLKLEGPVQIDFEGLRDRIHTVAQFRGGYNLYTRSPDGQWFAVVAENLGEPDVWLVDFLGEGLKQLTTDGPDPKALFFGPESRVLWYLDSDGRIHRVDRDQGSPRSVPFRVSLEYTYAGYWEALLRQAFWVIKDGFYDPRFHGVDWDAMYTKYLPMARQQQNRGSFYRVVRMMLGELNASHLGIWRSGRGRHNERVGYLGMQVNPTDEGLRIVRVVRDGPADRYGLHPGDLLLAVNDVPVADTNLYALLRYTRNQRVLLRVRRATGREETLEIEPIGPGELSDLLYEEWVEANRRFVDSVSQGRLAYVHVRAMDEESLERFKRDLYEQRDRQGLVLDIRYNGGGSTHDALLAILRRVHYLYSVERGDTAREYSSLFAWAKPIVLLINEHCYSDAEIFPQGFKELGLGTVVGTPTFGAVIGTRNLELFDGTTFRQPEEGWYRLSGLPLENHPVEPDVRVDNPPRYDNRTGDPQLRKAVEILLQQIGK